jgi:hypothetical protein
LPPSQSRLQRTEAALAAETAARDRAERALAEAQAMIRDLQTKIGHADLAKNEALEAARQMREAQAALVTAAEDHAQYQVEADERVRLAEEALEVAQSALSDERSLRRAAERSLRESIAARENAEQLLREMSERAPEPPAPPPAPVPAPLPTLTRRRPGPKVEIETPASRRRPRVSEPEPVAEPEPVKWWLMSKPVAKRR